MYTPYQTSAKVQWREWNRFTRNLPAPSRQTSKPVTFGISYEDAPEKLSPTKSSLASMWATSTFDDEPLSANDHFNSSWDNRNLASKGHPSVIELHTSNLSFSCWNSSSEARLSTEPKRLKNKKQSFSTWDNNDLENRTPERHSIEPEPCNSSGKSLSAWNKETGRTYSLVLLFGYFGRHAIEFITYPNPTTDSPKFERDPITYQLSNSWDNEGSDVQETEDYPSMAELHNSKLSFSLWNKDADDRHEARFPPTNDSPALSNQKSCFWKEDRSDEQEEAHHSSAAESLTISAQSSNSWQTTDSAQSKAESRSPSDYDSVVSNEQNRNDWDKSSDTETRQIQEPISELFIHGDQFSDSCDNNWSSEPFADNFPGTVIATCGIDDITMSTKSSDTGRKISKDEYRRNKEKYPNSKVNIHPVFRDIFNSETRTTCSRSVVRYTTEELLAVDLATNTSWWCAEVIAAVNIALKDINICDSFH
ncbi:unnamed protein product [Umbelopsis vinacea]